jgi:hypothetical protein
VGSGYLTTGPNQRLGAYTSPVGFKNAPHQLKLLLATTFTSQLAIRHSEVQ